MIHLVLLSGGSGTRLWPLSNDSRSKQFLKVLRDDQGNHVSMVQRVLSQIRRVSTDLDVAIDVTIAGCESQQDSIERQIEGAYELVLEPERRDTAPAIMLACAHLFFEQGADDKETVIVMPIDTYADQAYYNSITKLDAAVQSGAADLVLLGVKPTYPSEKYGYIVPALDEDDSCCKGDLRHVGELHHTGDQCCKDGPHYTGDPHYAGDPRHIDDPRPVERFIEKPGEKTAVQLIEQGALWNCGVFAFALGYLKNITQQYVTAADFQDLRARYRELPKNSFDYEVVEKASSVAVISYEGAWKDLGTWNTLCDEMADDASGRVVGVETCENTHVINELGLPLVALGLKDLAVIATPDGILVTDKAQSAKMKPYVQQAAESRPMYERRRWGTYRVIDSSVHPDGTKSLTKELVIEPGCQISYQRHQRRSEVWTIVSGCGEVVLDGCVQEVRAHSVIHIAAGRLHAVRATTELHVIEVQLGDVLTEDDIERFGNWWD